MSNPIRYDPPLVRALAAELDLALRGRLAHPTPRFDSDLSATLLLDRGEALRLDLHPRRGWTRLVPRPDGTEDRLPDAQITRVSAPPDERLLRIDLQEGSRFRGGRRSLWVELHTNQWNALLVDAEDGRIVSVLRAREAGARALRPGVEYQPPRARPRISPAGREREAVRADWHDLLSPIAPEERAHELVRRFAWTSPLNAPALLGAAAHERGEEELLRAFDRWSRLCEGSEGSPALLQTGRGLQPYPVALAGYSSEPAASLLAAMAAAAGAAAPREAAAAVAPEVLAAARNRLRSARRRLVRLNEELDKVGEADRIRMRGDLLLANLQRIQPGATRVTVTDYEGNRVRIRVDPSLRPHENAERYYDRARRKSRAEERLPELIEEAEAEVERWRAAIESAEGGNAPAWLESAAADAQPRSAAHQSAAGERLPYRRYRTSGGLEVRVGRTSRDNDRLTFGHSSPGDVWMHARSVPGSHVILRWRDAGAPPARDLEEAAVLAALYSKARTSGIVPVDWTRRRYVRKPRGAPPGRVVLQQAKTVFVEPDPALEERLREGAES